MANSVVIDYFSNTIDVDLEEELLLFRGRILKDDQTISSCNIAPEDTILLVVRKRPEDGMLVLVNRLLEHQVPPPQTSIPMLENYVQSLFDSTFSNTYFVEDMSQI